MTDRNTNHTPAKDTADKDTLAKSPEDPVTGQVRPQGGPLERPGTEAEEGANRHPPEPPGEGPGRSGERAAAYRENDA